MYDSRWIVCAIWLSVAALGCQGASKPHHASELTTTDPLILDGTNDDMRREVLRHIPIGTPIDEARDVVISNGFDCGEMELEEGPALVCSRRLGGESPVQIEWRLVLIHDTERITNVAVRSYGFSTESTMLPTVSPTDVGTNEPSHVETKPADTPPAEVTPAAPVAPAATVEAAEPEMTPRNPPANYRPLPEPRAATAAAG